jgi:hypothetical protein
MIKFSCEHTEIVQVDQKNKMLLVKLNHNYCKHAEIVQIVARGAVRFL